MARKQDRAPTFDVPCNWTKEQSDFLEVAVKKPVTKTKAFVFFAPGSACGADALGKVGLAHLPESTTASCSVDRGRGRHSTLPDLCWAHETHTLQS